MTIVLIRAIKRLGFFVAIMIIIAALLVNAGRLLTPYFNEHIPDLEGWVSRLVKVPVTIQKVYLSWNVYEPEIIFDEVKFLDAKTHQPKIQIDYIKVNLSLFHSLLSRKLIVDSIKASGAHLTVQQSASGKFSIQELNVTDNMTGSSVNADAIMAWIFSIPNLILQNIDIKFHPQQGADLVFLLNRLNLENSDNDHTLRGRAVLVQAIPTKIRVNLNWKGSIVDLKPISGKVYIYLEGINLPQWFSKENFQSISIQQGLGSAKIWADWNQSAWQTIQTNLQFYGVELKSETTKKSVVIPRINGQFGWRREGMNQVIAGDQIFVDLSERLWPETGFSITLSPDAHEKLVPTTIKIKYANIQDIQNILQTLALLPNEMQQDFIHYHPQGEIKNLQMYWNGQAFTPETVTLSTVFNNVGIDPVKQWPGFMNMSGRFSWDGKQGTIELNSQQSTIILNQVFLNPLSIAQLTGIIKLTKEDNASWLLQANNMVLVNADAKAFANMNLVIPQDQSPQVNLSANFEVMNATHISNYLPLKIFDPDLITWLRSAFISGKVDEGSVNLQGTLADFPFDNHKGTFVIKGHVKDAEFQFAPDWPVIQHLNGGLVFAGRAMNIDVDSGEILNIPLNHIKAVIPYIGDDQPQILDVEGHIESDLSQAVKFIHKTPLEKTIGMDLQPLDLSGPLQLQLGLSIPLRNPEKVKAQGDAVITKGTLQLPAWKLSLDQLNGAFHFTENDLSASHIQGKLLGEDASLSITTIPVKNAPSYIQVILQSQLNVTALQTWVNKSLSSIAKGKAAFAAELHLYSSRQSMQSTTVSMHTDMKGISLNLPLPYGKKVEDTRDLQIDVTKQDQILRAKINYNQLVTAALQFGLNNTGFNFVNGEVSLGGAANWQSQPGLVLSGTFKQLDWNVLQEKLSGKTTIDTSLFRKIHLDIESFDLLGQHLTQLRVDLSRPNNTSWLVNLNSNQATGQLTVTLNKAVIQSIQGKFQQINLQSIASEQNTSIDPRKIPSLNLQINSLNIGRKNLGAVTVRADPGPAGLTIQDLHMESSSAALHAAGEWRSTGAGKSATHLTGVLSSTRISDFLNDWGYGTSNFIGSKGDIHFDLTWPNTPFNPTLSGLFGKMSLSLGEGRIVNLSESNNVKMDLGRLLNIFNLSALPRQFNSDLKNTSGKGYDFDYAKGDFSIQHGNAFTDNTRIEGPIAGITLSGRIGLANEDFDLNMNLTPYVTSSLPIVATVAINPLAGVAAWMVDKVVGRAVSKVVTYRYTIKGPWKNPVWGQAGSSPSTRSSP